MIFIVVLGFIIRIKEVFGFSFCGGKRFIMIFGKEVEG